MKRMKNDKINRNYPDIQKNIKTTTTIKKSDYTQNINSCFEAHTSEVGGPELEHHGPHNQSASTYKPHSFPTQGSLKSFQDGVGSRPFLLLPSIQTRRVWQDPMTTSFCLIWE